MAERRRQVSTKINETPGVNGGFPCIGDTAIGVGLIVEEYHRIGNIDRVQYESFPQLTREQVRAAIRYYRKQPERVWDEIRANSVAWEEVVKRAVD